MFVKSNVLTQTFLTPSFVLFFLRSLFLLLLVSLRKSRLPLKALIFSTALTWMKMRKRKRTSKRKMKEKKKSRMSNVKRTKTQWKKKK